MRRLTAAFLLCYLPTASAAGCAPPTIPFEAEYELLRNGKPIGTTTITLAQRADGTFDYHLESKAKRGLIGFLGARFFEHSHWRVTGNRLQPLHFERGQSVAFHDRYYEAHFDWEAGMAHGEARGELWRTNSLPSETLDRLLVNLALLADLRCGRETLSYTVMEKGELETWQFDRETEQSLTVPGGSYRTLRVAKRHSDPERISFSWHAPELNWLAVQVTHQDDADEDRFTMKLQRYTPITE